LQLLLQNLLH
jgi:hypothetical protein